MKLDVVLYRTHILDNVVEREIRRLRKELPQYDHFLLGHRDFDAGDTQVASAASSPFILLSHRQLTTLPYPSKLHNGSWSNEGGGNDDLPILWFFRQNSQYENYWGIEYDVRYTGNWMVLFDDLSGSNADLLATTIMDRNSIPQWEWWRTLSDGFAAHHHTKAFQPFCRLSNRALQAIDAAYRDGAGGHYEATWSTICRSNGLLLEDIGGSGPYTSPERVNRHYLNDPYHWSMYPGTFLFRPTLWDRDFAVIDGGALTHGPKLWHPVKW